MNSDHAFGVSRSFSSRAWRAACPATSTVESLQKKGLSPLIAQLLAARDIGPEICDDYLHPTLRRLLPEPMSLADMDKAVARTLKAIQGGETIAVFGDYDVDGSCSVAVLKGFLSDVSQPPLTYVPDRMTEGYGPNAPAMLKLKEQGATLIITVDCGAGAGAALKAAQNAGLDVIVLDHHACEVPPPAFAHVNANKPGDTSGLGHVCAAGIVFLFAVALNRALRDAGWYQNRKEPDLRESLDIVGLATVCDVVPLTGVNRAYVRTGLNRLDAMHRTGIRALAQVAGAQPPFTAYHLGFVLGPRINAGGRVGRCGLGADLLTETDPARAAEYATALDIHNQERKSIEKEILDQAMLMAADQEDSPFILVSGDGWHPGVVGIVAGRLKEHYHKPALVAGFEGGMGRGSARSVNGANIGALIRAAAEAKVITGGGGHAMAAGFSLEPDQVEPLRAFLTARFAELTALEVEDLVLDATVSPSGANLDLLEEMEQLSPFGTGNAEPMIGVPGVRVMYADIVGKDHVRVTLTGGDGTRLQAIAFRAAQSELGQGILAARGQLLHVAGFLRKNSWNGRVTVQLQIQDAANASM